MIAVIVFLVQLSTPAHAFSSLEKLSFASKDAPHFCSTIRSDTKTWFQYPLTSEKYSIPPASVPRAWDLIRVCNVLPKPFTADMNSMLTDGLKQDPTKALKLFYTLAGSQCPYQCLDLAAGLVNTRIQNKSSDTQTDVGKDQIIQYLRLAKYPSIQIAKKEADVISLGLEKHLWSLTGDSLTEFTALKEEIRVTFSEYLKSFEAVDKSGSGEDETPINPKMLKSEVESYTTSQKLMDKVNKFVEKIH